MPPKGERRKQQIINTAKEMFIAKGFQSTHIGQVCEELNIARGTVYQYFSNKKEILYALLDSVIESIDDVLDPDDLKDFMGGKPEKPVIIEFINKRISSSIEMIISEPIVIKLIFKDIIGIDADVVDRVNKSIDSIKAAIAREINGLIEQGLFKSKINPRITASMLVGAIMMLVYEYDRRGENLLDENIINSITSTYLTGVYE
jgi:AcrR family transcriptional regulator